MLRRLLPPLAAAGLVFASFALAQTTPAAITGYLTPDTTPQTVRILPPPPAAGSGREADDEAIFARTRALAGTPRWSLATADADLKPGPGMFACAIGLDLNADNAPTLRRLSGHATISWAWGLILAELAPDRATEILMRARSIGESRVVCGVHYPSDVEEGRTNGAALVAALHSSPEFRADMEKARAEVAAARETPHVGPGDCLDTDQAAQHPAY
jgi:acid phosphatase (class A)